MVEVNSGFSTLAPVGTVVIGLAAGLACAMAVRMKF